jgi:hypothetical protein
VVVLHVDSYFLIHGQPGGIPHSGAHGGAHQFSRGPGFTNWGPIWYTVSRLNLGLLQGKVSTSFNVRFSRCNDTISYLIWINTHM